MDLQGPSRIARSRCTGCVLSERVAGRVWCWLGTGAGVEDFFKAVGQAALEYETEYLPELEKRREERAKEEAEKQQASMARLMKDLSLEKEKQAAGGAKAAAGGREEGEQEAAEN